MGGGQEFGHMWVELETLQYLVNDLEDGAVRTVGIASTLQNAGVSALQAEREDIEADVGASFIDDADDTKRHADSPYAQTVGKGVLLQGTAQRRG